MNFKNLNLISKIIIPVIVVGVVFVLALPNLINEQLIQSGSILIIKLKLTALLIFMVFILAITIYFVLTKFIKEPFIDIMEHLEKIKEDEFEQFKKRYDTTDIDSFIDELNKVINYLNIKDMDTNSLVEKMKKRESFTIDILNSQSSIIIVLDNKEIVSANKSFFKFFHEYSSVYEFKSKHKSLTEVFKKEDGYIYEFDGQDWLEYMLVFDSIYHRAKIIKENKEYIFKVEAIRTKDNRVIITMIDITEFEKFKEYLEASNKLLSEYKKAVDASAIVSKSNKQGIITYANDRFSQISGYTKDELIGKPHNLIRHPDMSKEAFKNLWETIKAKQIWRGQVKNLKKDGGEYYVDATIVPILDQNNEILEYLAVRYDVTDTIKSLQKAREVEAVKSSFLANMSHEIRTPLNGILGFAKLLENSNLPDKESSYVNIINNSAKSLLGIINDILDISKIESGKFELEKAPFDPFKELEITVELFVARANEKSIEILFFIDPAIPRKLIGDILRLKQVLSNFVGNAIKFTPDNGTIDIKIVLIEKDEKNVKVRFSVKDTGIGIPADKLESIFDPFSQADSSVTRKYGGTGLGLSISSNITKLMNSKIVVQSIIGEGSEFAFNVDFEYDNSGNSIRFPKKDFKIALYCEDHNCYSQMGLVKRYLDHYTTPQIIDNTDSLTNFDMLIINNNCLAEANFATNKPTIIITTKEITPPKMNGIVKVIKSPINPSKLLNAIMEIVNPNVSISHKEKEVTVLETFMATILVAEDNLVNQQLIKIMLENKGIKPVIVNNGKEAVDNICAGAIYDLIFMDINMPVMNGLEATEYILDYEHEKGIKHTPIIALTANAVAGDKEKYLDGGMDNYLPKPFEENMLDAILRKYLVLVLDIGSEANGDYIEVDVGDEFKNLHLEQQNLSIPKEITIEETFEEDTQKPHLEYSYDIDAAAANLGLSKKILLMILKTFVDSIDEDITKLVDAANSNSIDDIEKLAHKIKGASANLKMDGIFEVSKEIELSARELKIVDYIQLVKNLTIEVQNIKTIYSKLIS